MAAKRTPYRLWRVKVIRYTSATWRSKPTRETLYLLVKAKSADEAMAYGSAYYTNNGSFGRVLRSVEAREAACVELPLELTA